jgi:ERCC4-type nuclease
VRIPVLGELNLSESELPPHLVVHATKPKGVVARSLLAQGVEVLPIDDDEGPVDRYVLGPHVAADRRTRNGFLNGILDKTLFTSAIFLREHFDVPLLIVEGGVAPNYRSFSPDAVTGALSSMMLEYGLSVVCTTDATQTTHLLNTMARQAQHGIAEISLVPKRSAATLPDLQRRVVEMLPGCGRVMARELLQRYGSMRGIVDASASELRQIRGIGAKRADEIRRVLTAEYESLDTELQIEDAIEAHPALLFSEEPVTLVARQHRIRDDGVDRHVVDLVFHAPGSQELVLVELKRGRLEPAHRVQLRRYLEIAPESPLLGRYVAAGCRLRGVLASPDPGAWRCSDADISVVRLCPDATLQALRSLRRPRGQ